MDFVSERMIKFYYFSSLLILVGLVKAKQWNSIYKRVHPIVVTKNQLLHTIPEIGKEWNIELEFMATSFVQDTDSHTDTNFLWILNPNLNSRSYTLVTLGVTRGTKHIGFCLLLTPRKQRCQRSSAIVELNKWMNLKVTQVQKDGKSMVTVFIGGTHQYSEENLPPDKLIDVKLYACLGSKNITPQNQDAVNSSPRKFAFTNYSGFFFERRLFLGRLGGVEHMLCYLRQQCKHQQFRLF